MEKLHSFVVLVLVATSLTSPSISQIIAKRTNDTEDLSFLLDPLVSKHNVPSLGGILVDAYGDLAIGVSGVRKRGISVNVTAADLWHMGSVTKSMTATLIARLVEAGNLTWEDTVGDVFPHLELRPEFYIINYLHLLSHTTGIPRDPDWASLALSAPTVLEQRVNTVKALNDIVEPLPEPGTVELYSNWAVTVAGAMLEQVMGEQYEDLMSRLVFSPLGMTTAGFGKTAVIGDVSQPWSHHPNGLPVPYLTPLVVGPAGTAHCSIEDWAKFVRDHLRGKLGRPGLLKPESYAVLHTAPFKVGFALGWAYGTSDWAQGPTLWHNGSNGYNYALMIMDPEGGIAGIATCNQGDKHAATEDVIKILVMETRKLKQATKQPEAR